MENVLNKFHHFDSKLVSTLFDYSKKLNKINARYISQIQYAKIIGSLMYLMHCTRPDIAFVVGMLSRFTSNPGKEHWILISHILKYLKGSADFGLHYLF